MLEQPPALNIIYFYLTNGCNLSCRHCWISPRNNVDNQNIQFLPVNIFKSIIIQAKKIGLNKIKLTGGEPLLHPHIIDIIDIILENDLSLIIETNGLLCTNELSSIISKIKNIQVIPNRHCFDPMMPVIPAFCRERPFGVSVLEHCIKPMENWYYGKFGRFRYYHT